MNAPRMSARACFRPMMVSPKFKTFFNARENWYDFSVVEPAE